MTIIHPLDSLLYDLFPEGKGDEQKLVEVAKRFYSFGPFEPQVSIADSMLIVEVNTARIEEQKSRYDKVLSLCERGQFAQAKKDVQILINEAPQVSEYHRILGQILYEEEDREGAINALIDALRWNPENEFALLMMGNIFARNLDDLETALKYYEEVLKVKPNDHLALNNIGANLMQYGRTAEAAAYFKKAIAINNSYPNTYYALALTAEMQEDYGAAFDGALMALEKNDKKDRLYSSSFTLAIDSANKLSKTTSAKAIVESYAAELTEKYGKSIQIIEDDSIPTAAKIEFAENYNRDYHLVKYKPGYPSVEHLVMHELVHLELAEQARAEEVNQLYIAKQQHKNSFFYSLEKEANRMQKQGIPEKNIAGYLNALFEGINRQIFNAPVDLFIEDILFNRYPELKPFQFLSLLALLQEGIEAVTKPEIVKNSPVGILSKSKIFNLVNALHFKNLFKVDLTANHKPTKAELDQAITLYTEYEEYRADRKPGEEYELVQHWAEDLKLDKYFELVPELEYRPKTVENVIEEIEQDPYGLNEIDPSKERQMKKFIESHSTGEVNMAVCLYMVSALEYFGKLSVDEVKAIAFQIATLGGGGINPKKDDYTLPLLPGKTMSGYQVLAYYYVSFALALPEMLGAIAMPFDQEFALAKQMVQ